MNEKVDELVYEVPLTTILLLARQEQYSMNDNVMTLGDKEMILANNGNN